MELRVESADGCSMPSSCFVGVRIGETLKQGRYEPQRCYHFPQVDRRRNAKIDIYQHLGSCQVAVDPDAKSNHDVAVSNVSPSGPLMRLKVSVQSQGDDAAKKQRETRMKTLKSQANDYLAKHNIEERLSEAVKALLKEQPADPTDFLCRVLKGDGAPPVAAAAPPPQQQSSRQPEPVKQVSAPPPVAASKPQESSPLEEMSSLRMQACEVLMKASEDGELQKVLDDIKRDLDAQAAPAPAAKAPPKPPASSMPAAAPALMMPKPAMMMSTVNLCGSAFPTMGMQPTMFFI